MNYLETYRDPAKTSAIGQVLCYLPFTHPYNYNILLPYGPRHEKPVFGGLRTTKAQTSLRIRTVWSVPLLFAYWKVSFLDLLQAKFHISS